MGDCNIRKNAMIGGILMVAGGLAGAAVALLFAPQSGQKTRRDIARYSRKVRNKAEDVVDEFAGNLHDVMDSMGDRAEEILDKGKDLAQDAKAELLKAFDEGQAKLARQKEKLAKIIG